MIEANKAVLRRMPDGINCDSRPDMNVRPEAYRERFMEENVAGHPDAFDAVYLVDLRGGFNRCQPQLTGLPVLRGRFV